MVGWAAEPAPARVIALGGDVRAGGRGLAIGDGVSEGDEIASGRSSYATLEFTDHTLVRIRPDTRLRVEGHRATAVPAGIDTRLRLDSGALEVVVAQRRAPNFIIASLWGNITVRGTDFRARGGDEAMLVEVLEGAVDVTGTAGASGLARVEAGYGTLVRPMEAPLAPVKLLAAPDVSGIAELHERPVVRLRFAPLTGAQRYRIVAATDRDLLDVVVENTQRRPDVRMVDLRDGDYFYGVRAIDALGLEGAEARGRIRLKARPVPPAAQAPEPDATLPPGTVAFSWAAAEEAVAYRFQLATNETFAELLVNRGGLAAREIEVEKLDAGRYYWRVASLRASGDQGPFGDRQLLTLRAPEPQPTQ
jgi:hypothetical protein